MRKFFRDVGVYPTSHTDFRPTAFTRRDFRPPYRFTIGGVAEESFSFPTCRGFIFPHQQDEAFYKVGGCRREIVPMYFAHDVGGERKDIAQPAPVPRVERGARYKIDYRHDCNRFSLFRQTGHEYSPL